MSSYRLNNWYYSLKPDPTDPKKISLLGDHTWESLNGKFVVRMEGTDRKGNGEGNKYKVYPNYVQFGKDILKVPNKERFFHEVLLKKFPLKLYFDIDVHQGDQFDENRLFASLAMAVIETMAKDNFKINLNRDFVWLTSHDTGGTDGTGNSTGKRSYHLIVDNYYCRDYREVAEVVKIVRSYLPVDVQKLFDWGVYSPNRTFRTLGSVKRDSPGRPLSMLNRWKCGNTMIDYQYVEKYDNEALKFILELEASLITNVAHCRMIPWKLNQEEKVEQERDDVQEYYVNAALRFMVANEDCKTVAELPYTVREIAGSKIILLRNRPSMCRACERVHEQENPYVKVSGDLDPSKTKVSFWFCCRRNSENTFLGSVDKIQSSVATAATAVAVSPKFTMEDLMLKQIEVNKLQRSKSGKSAASELSDFKYKNAVANGVYK